MLVLQILLFYVLLPNVLLLFLLKSGLLKSLGNRFTLLVAYGIAPLLTGLLFSYLLQLVPRKTDVLYVSIVLLFWFCVFLYSKSKIKELVDVYHQLYLSVKKTFSLKHYVAFAILFLITILFSIQSFAYPVSDGDSAYYLSQTRAIYQTKDAHWEKNGSILVNGVNQYHYNTMIRPGIPSFMAFSFLFGQRDSNNYAFNFFFVYYYYLLLGMLLLLVSSVATQVGKNKLMAQFLAMAFFVFYWNMTRFYIFNNKEVAIFFFALASIYLTHDLMSSKVRQFKKELLLGILFGLNAFINYHGTVIGAFLLVILLIFSKLPFWQRIWQTLTIFVSHLLFSSFEFINTFGIYFWGVFKSALKLGASPPSMLAGDPTLKAEHIVMYQAQNYASMYLKGKLQILTGVGSYGFYFLFFLLTLCRRFTEIMNSLMAKIIVLLIAVYYLVIIDPFNLDKNDLAVVLWGSPKYAMFLVLLALVFVAVYFESTVRTLFKSIYKNKLVIAIVALVLAAILIIAKSQMISLGVKALLGVIEANREMSFYVNKVTLLYYLTIAFIIFFAISLIILFSKKISQNSGFKVYSAISILFMILPFFVVEVGKVPLLKTFNYLNKSPEVKLENVIYFGDEFKVYGYAKTILPKGTIVNTYLMELFSYNDYFNLRGLGFADGYYVITNKCPSESTVYKSGAYYLCHQQPAAQK